MDTLKNTSVFNDITLLDDNEDYHMISMDEVEEKEIQWLIPNYIPKEQITLIVNVLHTVLQRIALTPS